MGKNQLIKKIFEYTIGLKATTKWVEVVKKGTQDVGIIIETIDNGRETSQQLQKFTV